MLTNGYLTRVFDGKKEYPNVRPTVADIDRLVPIRRGCRNEVCFCSGACNAVIGYGKVVMQPLGRLGIGEE